MATGMNTVYEPLIDHGDIDGLVRLVDDYCSSRNWAQLLALRNACKAATQTGRQLWPVSTLAEYRLALLAPAETAAQVLGEDAGRFTIGPLTEVVAQHHQFVDIEPYLPHDPRTSFVAYECAIRGQYIDNEESLFEALEIPFTIGEWEPQYALADYRDNGAQFPSPELPPTSSMFAATPQGSLVADALNVVLTKTVLKHGWALKRFNRNDLCSVLIFQMVARTNGSCRTSCAGKCGKPQVWSVQAFSNMFVHR